MVFTIAGIYSRETWGVTESGTVTRNGIFLLSEIQMVSLHLKASSDGVEEPDETGGFESGAKRLYELRWRVQHQLGAFALCEERGSLRLTLD